MVDEELTRIVFDVEPDDGGGGETLWAAIKRTPKGFTYELLNSPFYVRGISHLDYVQATPSEWGLKFQSVVERGGHSTYWLRVPPDTPFEMFWAPLEALGCSYESGPVMNFEAGPLTPYAVDVPPDADIYEVYALLEKGEAEGVWRFAEGHCGHPIDRS